jgi:hypothetical protein
MRKLILALTAVSVALPAATIPTAADARRHRIRHHQTHYAYAHCRRHGGTTGALVGGAGGALVGSAVTSHGLAGPLIGGAAGALIGRHVERHSRC